MSYSLKMSERRDKLFTSRHIKDDFALHSATAAHSFGIVLREPPRCIIAWLLGQLPSVMSHCAVQLRL